MFEDILKKFFEKYKEFHRQDSENWNKPITDGQNNIVIGNEVMKTEEEYNELYCGEG